MAYEAMRAAEILAEQGVEAEVIDLRCVRPLDEDTLLDLDREDRTLVVADTSWALCGLSGEIAALAAEKAW